MSKITIATVAMPAVYDKQQNLRTMLNELNQAASEGADLIVFPEQSLQGYLTDTLNYDLENVAYQFDQAEIIPQGECIAVLIDEVIKLRVHAVIGLTERDADRPEVLYNCVVLLGPEGVIGRYRKVHQPGDEKHIYYPGDDFPVFATKIGRIGMLICYDKVFPESTRELALKGADIMIMPTAWGLAGDNDDPELDYMVDTYTLFGRVRALENQCWMVESNLFGPHGKLHYHGHSRIIDPHGRIIADTGFSSGIAMATVDVSAEIIRARSVAYIGYHFLKDYVPVNAPPSPLTVSQRHVKSSRE